MTRGRHTGFGGWRRGALGAGLVSAIGAVTLASSCTVWRTSGGTQQTSARTEASERGFEIHLCLSGSSKGRIQTANLPVRADAVIFYETDLGTYPRIWKGHVHHGGTPVGMDLIAHLRKVREDVDAKIPDQAFDGLVIIDWESRPFAWGVSMDEAYKELVRSHVRLDNPDLTGEELDRAAEARYDRDARRFLETTIGLCRQMRPRAKWGFYAFPNSTWYKEQKHGFITEASDVLFPGCYATRYGVRGVPENRSQASAEWFRGVVEHQVEFAREVGGDDKLVYPVVRPEYHEFNKVYGGKALNDLDARTSILGAQEAGADGVIFWVWADNDERARLLDDSLQSMRPFMIEAERRARQDSESEGEG